MFTTDEAANLFIEIIFARIYRNFYRDIEMTLLPEGLPGRVDDPVALQAWLDSLDKNQLKFIKEIVRSTIEESIYHFLDILDNQIGYPVKGQISEFAVYLQIYQNREDVSNNIPKEAVRLNNKYMHGYDDDQLQGLFFRRLQEGE